MATLSMSNSWTSGTYTISQSLSSDKRTATITCSMHLWRNDGGTSYNYDASNNFYITIGGNKKSFTVTSVSGTTGVTLTHSKSFTIGNDGNLNVAVSVDGSLSETTFQITGNNSTTYKVTGGAKATYTISYDANGGTNAPESQTKVYGTDLLLTTDIPSYPGYTFLGWATSSTGTISYYPGDTYTNNSSQALYAIWEVAKTYEYTFDVPNVTINSDQDGNAEIPSVPVTLNISGMEEEEKVFFGYRYCYVDDNHGNVSNPEINSDGFKNGYNLSYGETLTITIPNDIIEKSIKNCNNENNFKILMQIENNDTDLKFVDALTSNKLLLFQLVDFSFLTLNIDQCYRDDNDDIYMKVLVKFPKSYTAITSDHVKIPEIMVDNNFILPTYSSKTISDENLVTYDLILLSSDVDISTTHTISATIEDGISNASASVRLAKKSIDGIYIYKDDLRIEATEFIEGDKVGFDNALRVYANEFIETNEGVIIGNQMEFGKLIEL